ncbi:hypothetical protein [Hymenobacter elongatus]|uniref:Uncharacterized protein n=1 Tax=Hymenobacter elongatus TaxID=877208 RepID=A0A4Z0PSW4_9BACT|nr:hypothetical protein [Hymenobacter elongatus]TGE19943.1 hypothetical protein E5J99_02265 [Hymenobacter elongatus]
MKIFLLRPLTLAFLLASASLTACNTGTDSGDTNVENGADKTKDPDPGQMSTSDTNGSAGDTAKVTTGKDLYNHAGEAVDRDNDGVED